MADQLFAFLLALALWESPQKSTDADSDLQFRTLVDQYERGRREFITAIRKASTEEEGNKVVAELRPDEAKFIAKFFEIADTEPSSHIAAESANWILTHQPFDPDPRAVSLIAKHHVKSDAIGPLCLAIWASPKPENGVLLRQIARDNPDRQIRAMASVGLGYFLIYNCNRPRTDDNAAETARAIAMQSEAATILQSATDQYADILIDKVPVAEMCKSLLTDIHNFGIGKQAPEVDGMDAQGNRFKLSDYRGKVVVLTFSGDWCGPCKAMYPDQRAIAERYKDQPFAVVSVSTDEKVETLRKSINDREITWRCWWDGGMNGPICQAWNIQHYPTIFVIDPKGRIRYREVQGDLQKAVELLMTGSDK